jgi:hypothetical protein
VKGLLALVLGGFGLGAWLARRRRKGAEASPADELRARLAETRVAEPETPSDEPEPAPTDPEARRRKLHERTRANIDELGS